MGCGFSFQFYNDHFEPIHRELNMGSYKHQGDGLNKSIDSTFIGILIEYCNFYVLNEMIICQIN